LSSILSTIPAVGAQRDADEVELVCRHRGKRRLGSLRRARSRRGRA
jgi:hypothetical protein